MSVTRIMKQRRESGASITIPERIVLQRISNASKFDSGTIHILLYVNLLF